MRDTHSRIIAVAAKGELAGLGFRQQGRSRLWLADRGAWLNVVEFTPSSWSKSVSLRNAAHWLWLGAGFMSFNYTVEANGHAEFETEDQFRNAMSEIAATTRANATAINERFPSFSDIAEFVIDRARSSPGRLGTSWWGYEAGIAAALVGKHDEASSFLHGLSDDRVIMCAAPLLPLIGEPDAFRSKVIDFVAQERARLRLEPLIQPAF